MIRIFFAAFVFLLPWHALFVTYLKCKAGIDPTFLRFWKEITLLVVFITTVFWVLSKKHWNLSKILKDNTVVWLSIAFTLCSLVYVFFPYFTIKPSSVLGFKYDVFFLFALVVGLYIPSLRKDPSLFLKSVFTSTGLIVGIFLSWYLFFDIKTTTEIFGFSDAVSTYNAQSCLSFSQNVNGHHRFQATFGWPIRFSVFVVMAYILYLGYMLDKKYLNPLIKYSFVWIVGIITIIAVIFSYTKTSLLGLIFTLWVFWYMSWKYIYRGKLKKIYLLWGGGIGFLGLMSIAIAKKDLFLHLWAMINRLDNLSKSVEMFFYNPIGYGLGIAGPATQIGRSMESAWGWQISTAAPTNIATFLPENWYVQILLEQWLVWLWIFLSLLCVIAYELFLLVKSKKDFYSIALFSIFVWVMFMGLFTHVYEEAATSYILFLLVWIHLGSSSKIYH